MKYYAIKASIKYEKTILVPVDSVENIDEAIDLVNGNLEDGKIILLEEEPECEIGMSYAANEDGIIVLLDGEEKNYNICIKED